MIMKTKLITMMSCLMLSFFSMAQTGRIVGTVNDTEGNPLPGASVVIEGATIGTVTDFDGNFELSDIQAGEVTIYASYIGYTREEKVITINPGQTVRVDFVLAEDALNMDEIIVTGVFDERSKMESSVAITTLSGAVLQKQAPLSTADVLKNVPGVFVNSALGEIRNIVYSRGVSANSVDAADGYNYVSLQEDGLPVTNLVFGNFGADYFLRNDLSVRRLEAVRGGSASITSFNAPGGIFNYLSKTGGQTFEGTIQTKFGLQGDGNPYGRVDVNVGGPIGDNGFFYNVGAFYRHDEGVAEPEYPFNQGGQIKANLLKTHKNGFIKLYAKYLNDRNASYEFLPAVNFDDPEFAPGIEVTDSFLFPDLSTTVPDRSVTENVGFESSNIINPEEFVVGLEISHDLGNNWKINNNFKYSEKNVLWNTSAGVFPIEIDNLFTYVFTETLGVFGSYDYKDPDTGEVLANVVQSPNFDGEGNFTGFNFETTFNNLPGSQLFPNGGAFTNLGFLNRIDPREFMNQFSINKKLDKHNITAGLFYADSEISFDRLIAGKALQAIEDQPRVLDISVTQPDGTTLQITDPAGFAALSGALANQFLQQDYSQLATFFGHTWTITPKMNFDWGFRYETTQFQGSNQLGTPNPDINDPTFGGVDGDPLTVYDNRFAVLGEPVSYDETINTFSFSGALNYLFSDEFAIYGRFSRAEKALTNGFFFTIDSEFERDNLEAIPETVTQAEVGFKLSKPKYSAVVTPFYSVQDDVAGDFVTFTNPDGSIYNPPALFNSIRTYGVEIEGNFSLTKHFNIRTVATFQDAIARNWSVWEDNEPGPEDDERIDFSGTRADNNPNAIINVTPTYSSDKFFSSLSWKFLGDRPANVANAFDLPAFSQFDLALGYDFSDKLRVQGNINNLFNSRGVMSWAPPGGFPRSLNRQAFTREQLEQNPDAIFNILTIQPTSFFLTAIYNF